jgi:transposase
MQRKGNIIAHGNQVENLVSVGVDMGGALWATAIHYWKSGKDCYFGFKDKKEINKEECLYQKISELINAGYKVQVYYEAGRYGYAPARIIKNLGAEVTILPINKLQVIMCGKTIKTDKLDAKFLGGLHPDDNLPSVYIPTNMEEGLRDAERELMRLKKSINRVNAQIIAIIERTNLRTPKAHRTSRSWKRWLVKISNDIEFRQLSEFMTCRLKNMVEELELFENHLAEWEARIDKKQDKDRERARKENIEMVEEQLSKYKGIGDVIARHFAWEIGDFSRFKNGKQFTSYFGMTPSPFASGTMNREQGISKSGGTSLRKMAVELAWLWRRWQPDSHLTKKWNSRLEQKGRARKTAIVALARQLLVALWRDVMYNESIEGAIINNAVKL